jgi:hypothetical protein
MGLRTTRTLITTQAAAKIFGVSMGRIRQMALAGTLWHELLGEHCLVFDRDEVTQKAEALAAARAAGHVRGPQPGGFKKDRPISKKRQKPG